MRLLEPDFRILGRGHIKEWCKSVLQMLSGLFCTQPQLRHFKTMFHNAKLKPRLSCGYM